ADGTERVAGVVVRYAVVVDPTHNSCEAVDEVALATGAGGRGPRRCRVGVPERRTPHPLRFRRAVAPAPGTATR
ncbi:hypothetical protein, partial [Streptomyces alkaliphilus]|uniref:hypothetical protein n=1 Tax=Streptomyces alkaliphilus TaxID=1472722 RepID=UPI001E5A12BA